MALNRIHLREQLVLVEMTDALQLRIDARRYQTAAREIRLTLRDELGALPMHVFASELLPALQTTAQNNYFERHRRFAETDGGVSAAQAQRLADACLHRAAARDPRR